MYGHRLGIAIDNRDFSIFEASEGVSQQHTLTTSLGSNKKEGLIMQEPDVKQICVFEHILRFYDREVALCRRCHLHVLGAQFLIRHCSVCL